MNLTLTRTDYDDELTDGILSDEKGKKICFTLELPQKANNNQVSCIPEGRYKFRKLFSSKFGRWVYRLDGVPDRSLIDIHCGNTVLDIQGCILVGTKQGTLSVKGKIYPAVLNSREALDKVLGIGGSEGFITITSEGK